MKQFIKEEWWLGIMLVGMALLTWSISQGGESFPGQTIMACILIVFGVNMGSRDNKRL